MDADVRVSRPDALARLAQFVEESGAALVSGVPRQEMRGFMEKLIIPLIHFVLLAFLPVRRMRASTDPRFAAACGQIIAVRRDAYEQCRRTRRRWPVGCTRLLHWPAHFARTISTTDLFDATNTFHCRMYRTASEVWNGFAKNAHEGLGSPRLIGPATLLLFGGQVLPLCLLATTLSPLALAFAVTGTVAEFLPRLLAVARFRQPLLGALLHPFAICALLAIQWSAFLRSLRQPPAVWKDRSYYPAPAI